MAQFPLGTAAVNLIGTVNNPATAQNPDGNYQAVGLERQGSVEVSEVHGRYGASAARGNMFFASSGLAGTVVKLSAATMAAVNFAVLNPVGSGKNLELINMSWQKFGTGTQIPGQLGLAFQTNIASAGVPTSLTAGTINNCLIGGGLATVASFYTVATLTNSAIGANFVHYWFTQDPLATVVTQAQDFFDIGGMLVMPPGTLCVPVAAITGTHIEATISLCWAEYLI